MARIVQWLTHSLSNDENWFYHSCHQIPVLLVRESFPICFLFYCGIFTRAYISTTIPTVSPNTSYEKESCFTSKLKEG